MTSKGTLKDFPMGVVVRMMEEQQLQGNKPDVKVFQREAIASAGGGGFDWDETEDNWSFWSEVINKKNFNLFFEKYPEYERYNLS